MMKKSSKKKRRSISDPSALKDPSTRESSSSIAQGEGDIKEKATTDLTGPIGQQQSDDDKGSSGAAQEKEQPKPNEPPPTPSSSKKVKKPGSKRRHSITNSSGVNKDKEKGSSSGSRDKEGKAKTTKASENVPGSDADHGRKTSMATSGEKQDNNNPQAPVVTVEGVPSSDKGEDTATAAATSEAAAGTTPASEGPEKPHTPKIKRKGRRHSTGTGTSTTSSGKDTTAPAPSATSAAVPSTPRRKKSTTKRHMSDGSSGKHHHRSLSTSDIQHHQRRNNDNSATSGNNNSSGTPFHNVLAEDSSNAKLRHSTKTINSAATAASTEGSTRSTRSRRSTRVHSNKSNTKDATTVPKTPSTRRKHLISASSERISSDRRDNKAAPSSLLMSAASERHIPSEPKLLSSTRSGSHSSSGGSSNNPLRSSRRRASKTSISTGHNNSIKSSCSTLVSKSSKDSTTKKSKKERSSKPSRRGSRAKKEAAAAGDDDEPPPLTREPEKTEEGSLVVDSTTGDATSTVKANTTDASKGSELATAAGTSSVDETGTRETIGDQNIDDDQKPVGNDTTTTTGAMEEGGTNNQQKQHKLVVDNNDKGLAITSSSDENATKNMHDENLPNFEVADFSFADLDKAKDNAITSSNEEKATTKKPETNLPHFSVADFSFDDFEFDDDGDDNDAKVPPSDAEKGAPNKEPPAPIRETNVDESGRKAVPPQEDMKEPGTQPTGTGGWVCENCHEFHDESDLQFCGMCGTTRTTGTASTMNKPSTRRKSGTLVDGANTAKSTGGSKRPTKAAGGGSTSPAVSSRKIKTRDKTTTTPRSRSKGKVALGKSSDGAGTNVMVTSYLDTDIDQGDETDLMNEQNTTSESVAPPTTPRRSKQNTIRRSKSDVTKLATGQGVTGSAPETPKKKKSVQRSKSFAPVTPVGATATVPHLQRKASVRQAIPRRAKSSSKDYVYHLQHHQDNGDNNLMATSSHSVGGRPLSQSSQSAHSVSSRRSHTDSGGRRAAPPSLMKSAPGIDSDDDDDAGEFATDDGGDVGLTKSPRRPQSSRNVVGEDTGLTKSPRRPQSSRTVVGADQGTDDVMRTPRTPRRASLGIRSKPTDGPEAGTRTPSRRRRGSIEMRSKSMDESASGPLAARARAMKNKNSDAHDDKPQENHENNTSGALHYSAIDIDFELDESGNQAAPQLAEYATTPRRAARDRVASQPTPKRDIAGGDPRDHLAKTDHAGDHDTTGISARRRIRRMSLTNLETTRSEMQAVPDLEEYNVKPHAHAHAQQAPPTPKGSLAARNRARRASLGHLQVDDSAPVVVEKPAAADAKKPARQSRGGRRGFNSGDPMLKQALAHLPQDHIPVRDDLQEEWKRREEAEQLEALRLAEQLKNAPVEKEEAAVATLELDADEQEDLSDLSSNEG